MKISVWTNFCHVVMQYEVLIKIEVLGFMFWPKKYFSAQEKCITKINNFNKFFRTFVKSSF